MNLNNLTLLIIISLFSNAQAADIGTQSSEPDSLLRRKMTIEQQWITQGMRLTQEKDYQAAIPYFTNALEEFEIKGVIKAIVLYELAFCQSFEPEPQREKIISTLNQALEILDPILKERQGTDSFRPLKVKGHCLYLRGGHKAYLNQSIGANQDFKASLAIKEFKGQHRAECLYFMGRYAQNQGNKDGAIAYYTQALGLQECPLKNQLFIQKALKELGQ